MKAAAKKMCHPDVQGALRHMNAFLFMTFLMINFGLIH